MQFEHAALRGGVTKQTVKRRHERCGNAVHELSKASRRVCAEYLENESDKDQAFDQAEDPVHQLLRTVRDASTRRERVVGDCLLSIYFGAWPLDRPDFGCRSRDIGYFASRRGWCCFDDVFGFIHGGLS